MHVCWVQRPLAVSWGAVQSPLLSLRCRDSRWVKTSTGLGIRKHHFCQPPWNCSYFGPVCVPLILGEYIWEGGGRKQTLANPEKEDRNSEQSVAGSLLLQTAQSAVPIRGSRVPSCSWHARCQEPPPPFSLCRQGERLSSSVNSSCLKASPRQRYWSRPR